MQWDSPNVPDDAWLIEASGWLLRGADTATAPSWRGRRMSAAEVAAEVDRAAGRDDHRKLA